MRMIESAEEFVELARSGDPLLRRRVLHWPAPEGVWLELVDRYPEMHPLLARSKMVPGTVLHILAGDTDDSVRATVAGRIRANAETLLVLARDPAPVVREAVARNPTAQREVLEVLVRDTEDSVATAAADTIERVHEMPWLRLEVAAEDAHAFLACLGLGALRAYRSGVPGADGCAMGVSRLAMWDQLAEVPGVSRELIDVLRWSEDLWLYKEHFPRARFEQVLDERIALLEGELAKADGERMWVRWLGESRHAP